MPQQTTRRPIVLGSVALLLALLVGGIWVLPGMLDWGRYRDGIAALAAERLGRPVRIGGAVSLQLLPQPVLTAADVAVEDVGDGIDLRAHALRLRVGLGPLLAGRIDARELTLQGADLRLPWPPPAGALARRLPASVTDLRARVEDSRLQVGDLTLTGIDATLGTDPDTGTLSAAGMGEAGGRTWQFTGRLARPGRDGAAGLDVSLDGQGKLQDTGGTFSGQIGADGALSGRVAGRGRDLSQLLPAPALPWRGDGRLSAAAGVAVADELALEIDGAPARGAVALRVMPQARLDLTITAGRLDLDAWLPALLGRVPPNTRPVLPTGIDLAAEAATLAGGTVRRLRGAVDLDGDSIVVREATAVLPGGAQLSLSGRVTGGANPSFDGPVTLEAPDLRTSLRWLERVLPQPVASLPGGVLRTASLSARVVASAGQAAVTDLRGLVDGVAVSGTASVRVGARLAVSAGLSLERLSVEDWVPDVPAAGLPDAALAMLTRLRGVDADVRVQAASAIWGAVPLGAVSFELQSEATRVFLRRLEAQPAGLRLSASGQAGEGGRLADVRVEVTGTDFAVLEPALPSELSGLAPLLRGPGSGLLQASGPPEALATKVTVELSDLRLETEPLLNLPLRRGAGPLTLHHPGAPRLLQTLGVDGTVVWLGDGSMSLVGQVAAGPGRIELNGATLAAGALRASGSLVFEDRRVTGQVGAETLPLPLPYPRSRDPLPLQALRGWQAAVHLEAAEVLVGLAPVMENAVADVSLEAGVLRLAEGRGRLAGGSVVGAASVDASAEPPVIVVQAQATGLAIGGGVFGTPLDLVAGDAEAAIQLSAAGYSPAALVATLAGTVTVRVHDGIAVGFDLAAAGAVLPRPAEVGAALLAGQTAFDVLEASLRFSQGVVDGQALLSSAAGLGQLVGSLDVLGGTLDGRLGLVPAGDGMPSLDVRVTGAAGDPVRTPELAGLARWLADRP